MFSHRPPQAYVFFVALFAAIALAPPGRALVFDSFGDGFWNAINQNNSKALVVSGTSASQAAVVAGDFGQQFEVLLNLEDGTFRIRNRDSLKCIGAKNGATAVGTAVVEINYTGSNDQRWNLVDAGGGYWQIVNAAANLALQTDAAATASVTLQGKSTSNLQHWQFNYQTHYPKKGGAGWDDKWAQFGVSWGYNWGATTGAAQPDSFVYEPMKWTRYWPGTGDLGGGYGAMHTTPKPVYIMGFNEPDHSDQANMTVQSAIDGWPDLQSQNVPLVSPAAASAFGGWLGDFYGRINSLGYRVDYTAVHWYAYPSADNLINHLQSVYNTWGRPVWLTEFGNVDWSSNQSWSEEDDWRFLAEFMWRAEDLIWLKRYSMFVFNADPPANPWSNSPGTRSNMLKGDNTTLTSIGELYSAWDADRTIHPRTPYLIQGQNSMHRLSTSPANSQFPGSQLQFPSPVSIHVSSAQAQWTFVPSPTAGQSYINSLLDGRRLSTDGSGVTLAPFGTTGVNVQWTISSPDSYGYFYIDNPTYGKALFCQRWNNGDGSPNSIYYGVTPSGNPQDITRFRYVKPVAAVTVPAAAPAAPASVVAIPGDRNVALSWTGTGFVYTVSRSTTSGGPYSVLASNLQTLDFTDNSALNGSTYYYVVSAANILSEASGNSAQVSATPLASLSGVAMMADYKFENGDATDSSDRQQNGAVNGGVTFASPGQVDGAAATFDGVNGYVQIPVEVANDFSIAFWMKTTSAGGAGTQWWAGNGLVDGEVAGAAADFGTSLVGTKVAFGVGNPDTTIISMSDVNDGAWHHVAVTRNGTSGAMQLFFDGTLQAAATGPTGTRTAPPTLRIGGIQTGFNFFRGSLDEVRLYNYVLATTDVAKLFRPGNAPIAIYKFEGNAQDASGNGNHGTVAGALSYVTGKVDAQAAQFNGSNSVLIPASLVNDFSIAYWVKTTATASSGQWWSGMGLVDGEVSGSVADFGTALVANKAAFGVGNPDTTITSTTAINDGAWHHIAATRNSASGAMRLYVDGGLQASATGPTGARTAPPALRLGGMQPGYGYFLGTLDDVRLYSYPMMPGQVFALINPTPAPWTDTDIGAPAATGYGARTAGGLWTVGGSGADIWAGSDQCNFVNQTLTGDGSLVTRVTALPTNADGTSTPNSKAGIMIRASTAANAPFADLVFDVSQGLQFHNRSTAGASVVQPVANVALGAAPVWLRLTRGGNVFQAHYTTVSSPTASDWIFICSTTITLPASALAGLAVTSHVDGTMSEASFDNVQLNTNAAPTISPVSNQTINENTATATLPVTVGDLETPPASLTLTAISSNTTLAPVANITFGGAGANRTVRVTPAAFQSGTTTITLKVGDGLLTATSAFNLIVQTTPAGSWRQQWFGSTAASGNAADTADPDGDGITNFWERAFNLNPNIPDPATVWPTVSQGGGMLTLAYQRNIAAADLIYQVLWSSDLATWSATGVTDDLISTNGGTQLRIGQVPLSFGSPLFLRLKITPTP